MTDLMWMDHALCLGQPTSLFFLEDREPLSNGRFNDADELCAACPVIAECRVYSARERWGFWAGTFKERIVPGTKKEHTRKPVDR